MTKTHKKQMERHDLRRLAMQVLYQIDVTGQTDVAELADGLDEEHDSPEARLAAAEVAVHAWAKHADYDALVAELAPDWPTHRQPPVDRAILRLACHEIATAAAPAKVAINEAIELAKQFGAEHSPAFINGVLDKAAKRLAPAPGSTPAPGSAPAPGSKPSTGDDWLDDAVRDA